MQRKYRRSLICFSVIFFFLVVLFYYFISEPLSIKPAVIVFMIIAVAPLIFTLLRFEIEFSKTNKELTGSDECSDINKNVIKLFRNKLSGIVIFNRDGLIFGINDAASEILALDKEDILKNRNMYNLFSIFKEPFCSRVEKFGITEDSLAKGEKAGNNLAEEFEFEKINGGNAVAVGKIEKFDGVGEHFFISFYDISAIRDIKSKIDYMVYYDPLTKLLNRAGFLLKLERTYSRSPAILVFIICNFSIVNETVGSTAGDEVLKEIFYLLNKTARNDEILARIGGIEFAVASDKILSSSHSIEAAIRFSKVLEKPLSIYGNEIKLSAAVGVMLPVIEKTMEDSLSCALLAAREASKKTNGEVFLFSDGQQENSLRKIILEKHLHNNILKSDFEIYFQPIINIESGKCKGMEALARVKSGAGDQISPAEFIPIAETTRLIFNLSEILFDFSAEGFIELKKNNPDIYLSLNVSTLLFEKNIMEELLSNHIERKGVNPNDVVIEITEIALISDLGRCRPTIDSLISRGYSIAIDDFGLGNSSDIIHYLNISKIKIDSSIIKNIDVIQTDLCFLRAVLSMCETLGIETIAEGVEVLAHEKILKELNCPLAQGYLYARPMNLVDCIKYLEFNP